MKNKKFVTAVVLFLCCVMILTGGISAQEKERERLREAMVGVETFELPSGYAQMDWTDDDGTMHEVKMKAILHLNKKNAQYETYVRMLPDLEPQMTDNMLNTVCVSLMTDPPDASGLQGEYGSMLEDYIAVTLSTAFFNDPDFISGCEIVLLEYE